LDDCSLSSSSVSSVGSQRVRFFIEGVGYRAFRRPAVTTTGAVSGLIKAGQRQPRAGGENWKKKRAEPRRGRRKQGRHWTGETGKTTNRKQRGGGRKKKGLRHKEQTQTKEEENKEGEPAGERESDRERGGGRDQEKNRANQHRNREAKHTQKNREETRGTSKHRQNKKRRTNSQNNKNEEGRRRKALSRPGQ